ncbi:MAG TPA: four helix bundle protein [Niabella sp.]|nr:four helix bundle protein [Niabella sp.]
MNPYQFSFEKLEVWQLARKLTCDIYKETQSFSTDEKYALVPQMRRAVVSIAANIAEGSTRQTAKDQAHFTTIAYGSLMELFNFLVLASDLSYLSEDSLHRYRRQVQTLSIKLSNLKSSQLKRVNKLLFLTLMIFSPHIIRPLVALNNVM